LLLLLVLLLCESKRVGAGGVLFNLEIGQPLLQPWRIAVYLAMDARVAFSGFSIFSNDFFLWVL